MQGLASGAVEVYYRIRPPHADEGPFLKEERKLIDTVAERIGSVITGRHLKSAFQGWQIASTARRGAVRASGGQCSTSCGETDTALLLRISRKMINHLASSGVREAQALLNGSGRRRSTASPSRRTRTGRCARGPPAGAFDIETFEIAERNLSEQRNPRVPDQVDQGREGGFLVRALEGQETPLGDIADAVERFEHADVEERDLSLSVQKGLRVSLCRRFFSERPRVHQRRQGSDRGQATSTTRRPRHPAVALLRQARRQERRPVPRQEDRREVAVTPSCSGNIKVPRTWYVPSDGILEFIHYNNLEDVLSRKYMEIDQIRQDYPHLVQLFKSSAFPPAMAKGLSIALEDFGSAADHRAQLEPARGPRGLGVLRQVQEPVPRQSGHARPSGSRADGRDRRSVRVGVRAGSRPNTARSAACSTCTRRWAS